MRVALRDASFYGSARFADCLVQPSYVPVYHAIRSSDPHYSRCGRLIAGFTETDHTGVLGHCGRPGCKQAFAAASGETQPQQGGSEA